LNAIFFASNSFLESVTICLFNLGTKGLACNYDCILTTTSSVLQSLATAPM
jgi:hypothetical protein